MPSLKYPNKLSKLRKRKCVICKIVFWKNISPSEIKKGYGKVCSRNCKNKLISLSRTTGYYKKCYTCGKYFWMRISEENHHGSCRKYCSRKCWRPKFGTGKSISTDGYYVLGGRKVHRMLMEKHIKRKLLPTEIVHHINMDKLDNRIENLLIVGRSEHNTIHKFHKLFHR